MAMRAGHGRAGEREATTQGLSKMQREGKAGKGKLLGKLWREAPPSYACLAPGDDASETGDVVIVVSSGGQGRLINHGHSAL